MTASARIVLFKSKTYKDKTHPVYLQVTINRKNKYYSLGNTFKCKPEQWNSTDRRFNKTFPNYKKANRNISKSIATAEDILIDLENFSPGFSHDDFTRKYQHKVTKLYLFDYTDKIITRLKKAGKVGNAAAYEIAKNQFKKYMGKDKEMTAISKKDLQLFVEHCQAKELKPGTISNYLRTIRAVYNRARKEEDFNYYPFEGFNWKQLKHQTAKRAITKDQILELLNYDAEPGTDKFDAIQLAAFIYFCEGINFADVAKIQDKNIIHSNGIDILQYNRSKGGKLYETPLVKRALEILKYYRSRTDNKYIFPILNEYIHITPEQMRTRRKTALKKYNGILREIANELEIPMKVTTYTVRHTFASVLAKEGISPLTISEMMGHSDLKTTQIYLKELDHSERIEAAKKLTN